MKATLAVLAGDGIGREVVPEAVKLLKAVGERFGHVFEFISGDVGGQAIEKVGVPLPQETLTLAKQSTAVLLGASLSARAADPGRIWRPSRDRRPANNF